MHALAHAEQVRSDPDPGAVLPTPPTRVDVWFTERVTPTVSTIQVSDVNRRRVDTGDAVVDPADVRHMSVGLQTLPSGRYTVVWTNVAADDGHPSKATFAFTVLGPTTGSVVAAAVPSPLASSAGQLLATATDRAMEIVDVVTGWLTIAALFLASGGAAFALCCLLPALARAGEVAAACIALLTRRFLLLMAVYGAVGAAAAVGSLLAKAEIATGLPFRNLISADVLGALLTPWSGRMWIAREAVLLGIAAAALAGVLLQRRGSVAPGGRGPRAILAAIVALGAVGVVSQALESHVAAGHVARAWPLGAVALSIHLLAVGLWAGGLGCALLLWPAWQRADATVRQALAAGAITRFSALALPSVAAVAVTGAYVAALLLPAPSDLLTSAYGQALVVKTVLFLALILLGTANRRALAALAGRATGRLGAATRSPAWRPWDRSAARPDIRPDLAVLGAAGARLLRTMRRELAASAMLAAGPPGVALSAAAVQRESTASLATVSLMPTPVPQPGPAPATPVPATLRGVLAFHPDPPLQGGADATLRLLDGAGQPVQGARLQATWLMPQHAHVEQTAWQEVASPVGTYQARPELSMAGAWLADVSVHLPDGQATRLHFAFNVGERGLLDAGGNGASTGAGATPAPALTTPPALSPLGSPGTTPTASATARPSPATSPVELAQQRPTPSPTPSATAPEPPVPTTALPQAGDLTLSGSAGRALVAVTLRPGLPGRNDVLVYLLPFDGEATAAGIPVELSIDGRSLATQACGPTCRSVSLDVQGGERADVHVVGTQGGTATFLLPSLPAPDGAGLLQRMLARMHGLRTYRVDEVFNPYDPPKRASYAYQAPDRMQFVGSSGSQVIYVGATSYLRDGPAAPWRVEATGSPLQVPLYVWDAPGEHRYVAPRIVGTARVEGADTQILAFFMQAGPVPIWFRLWVDSTGLVHRAGMRAQGHFMDHRYYDFDAPLTIAPPVN